MNSRPKVQWEDPPGSRSGASGGIWLPILEPLMAEPGRWARVRETPAPGAAYQTAKNLRDRSVQIPDGEWEFTGVKLPDGRGAVFARYIGSNGKAD